MKPNAGMRFALASNAATSSPVTFRYASSDGTIIGVALVDEALDRPAETFGLALTDTRGATVGDGDAAGAIHDDPEPELEFGPASYRLVDEGRDAVVAARLSRCAS